MTNHWMLRQMAIVVIGLMLVLGGHEALAQATPDQVKAGEKTPAERNHALGAAQVVDFGQQQKDPYALIVAVRMMTQFPEPVTMTTLDEGQEQKATDDLGVHDPLELLAEAKGYAEGNEALSRDIDDLIAQVEAEEKPKHHMCFWGWCYGIWNCWFYCH